MTKINAWKCEVCGTIFIEGDCGFHGSSDIKILLSGGGWGMPDRKIDWNDVCLACRSNIEGAIDTSIAQCKNRS